MMIGRSEVGSVCRSFFEHHDAPTHLVEVAAHRRAVDDLLEDAHALRRVKGALRDVFLEGVGVVRSP